MHNFCGGCAVQWFRQNNTCPADRAVITGLNDNRTLAEMVQIFLRQFPEKARSEEEVTQLDALYRPGQPVSIAVLESRWSELALRLTWLQITIYH